MDWWFTGSILLLGISIGSSGYFHRGIRLPVLGELFRHYEMKMKRIMCRLFGLFFRRATRSKVIAFPRISRFQRSSRH